MPSLSGKLCFWWCMSGKLVLKVVFGGWHKVSGVLPWKKFVTIFLWKFVMEVFWSWRSCHTPHGRLFAWRTPNQRALRGPSSDMKRSLSQGAVRDRRTSFVCVQGELLRHQMWQVIRNVAMSEMTKNPTMKTLMTTVMSLKTTMTTVQHQVLKIVWSCFSLVYGTTWLYSGCPLVFMVSLLPPLQGLYDFLWASVKSPVSPSFNCHSVKVFHVGFRGCLFVHAHVVLLVLEEALRDCSVIQFLCRGSTTSTPLNILQCLSRDVHDESTVDALLCLLLDFCGNAL